MMKDMLPMTVELVRAHTANENTLFVKNGSHVPAGSVLACNRTRELMLVGLAGKPCLDVSRAYFSERPPEPMLEGEILTVISLPEKP